MTFLATDTSYVATAFATNWDVTQNPVPNTAYNDLYLDSGSNLATVGNIDDMSQTVVQSLWTWFGEYVFNIFLGVPYKIILGNTSLQQSLIKFYLTNSILLINDYLTPDQLADYGINTSQPINIRFDFNKQTRSDNITITMLLNNGQQVNLSA